MVNRTSALISKYNTGSFSIDNKITLIFKEIKDLDIKQVAGWTSTLKNVEAKLSNFFNISGAPGFNQALSNAKIHLLRIEPLKWWLIGDRNFELTSAEGTIVDLSHAFTAIEIKGGNVKYFLNRHLPLDLRDNSFQINSVASSAIHHVSIKIWRNDKSYILFIPRGFALSIWEILLETASQFGYKVL